MNLEQAVAIFESHLATSHFQDCCETRRAVLHHDVRDVALAVLGRASPLNQAAREEAIRVAIYRLFPEGEKP